MIRVRRAAAVLVASALVAGFLASSSAPSTAAGTWGIRADTLIDRAMAADGYGDPGPLEYGLLTLALGLRQGWDSVNTAHYLQELLAIQHPDGGFGLPPTPDIAYTVSMAGHAGPALLAAHHANVSYADVDGALQRMITKLWTVPLVPVTGPGKCLSYTVPLVHNYCIHNASFGAAAFLVEAHQAGFGPDPTWLTSVITVHEVGAFNRWWRNWPYSNRPTQVDVPQDPAHMAYTVESAMALAPGIGDNAVKANLNIGGTDWRWPLAHAALTQHNCAAGQRWLTEFDQWTAGLSATDFQLLVQAAQAAALNAEACE